MRLAVLSALAFLLPLSAQDWSPWRADSTFPGIEVRERCSGFNEFSNRYMWEIQLRNGYTKSIDLAWEAEPSLLHGPDSQADHAQAVRPGETIDAHATAPKDCASGLAVRVAEVREGAASFKEGSAVAQNSRNQLQVQIVGNSVTGVWISPRFSLQITAPLPQKIAGAVRVDGPDPAGPPLKTRE